LKEKGLGLVSVVDVLDHWTQAYPTLAVLQKCVFDLIDAACSKASRELYVTNRGNLFVWLTNGTYKNAPVMQLALHQAPVATNDYTILTRLTHLQ
jgi:hypothetical protein